MTSKRKRATVATVAQRNNLNSDQVPSPLFTHGEPDYFSALTEKRQLRETAKWLLAHIHDLNWGRRAVYTEHDSPDQLQTLVPLHANKKDVVERFIRREKFFYPQRLRQKLIIRHLLGEPVEHHVNDRGSRGFESLIAHL